MRGHLTAPRAELDLHSLARDLPGATLIASDSAGSLLVHGIELDSRQVRAGDLFAALPGHHFHGAHFAGQAVAGGAAAILTDREGLEQVSRSGADLVPVLVIDDPRASLGQISARLFGHPARDLTLLAVTGTNGKTTVAAMIAAGLRSAGWLAGTIGTVGVTLGEEVYPATRTTPEAPHLQALLAAMRAKQAQAVALEVSSHALCEHRVDGLDFAVAAFTNLSQDHLDYHGTMEAYYQAKASLFLPQRTKFAVIGVDDAWGKRLAMQSEVPRWTYSVLGEDADWQLTGEPGAWRIEGPQGHRQALSVGLPGRFNLANALCSYAVLRHLGIPGPVIAAGLAQARVPGRMEPIGRGAVRGIVDYAHSPDAIRRVIASVRNEVSGRIIVVLGAGGDRDRGKRPLMGAAAARLADVVVVTDDNPRSEDPASIRAAVLEGATSVTNGASGAAEVVEVPDRAEAVTVAARLARPGDTVLLLGKGHEQGQEIAGVVRPFDDRQVLAAALDRAGTGGVAADGGRP